MTIKWGVIGAGGIADRRTIPEGIIPAKNAELVAVMDVDEDKAKAVAQKYGNVKFYTREKELINDPDVEAVYIGTPTVFHYQQTCLAAEAKKHVLCEKPMAMNIQEAEQMIEACKKNRVKLGLGYMMRFHAYHLRAKEMVEQGQLGQMVMGRAQLSCWYPPIDGAWRQVPELGGGGSLVDLGSHCIDLLEMFMGKVTEVSCFTNTLVHSYQTEDTALILLRFDNGAYGIVDNCFNIPDASSKNILEIYGTKGSILAKGTIGQMPGGEMMAYLEKETKGWAAQQERTETPGEEKITPQPINMYQAEIEHFSDCIEKDEQPVISGENGLWNLKTTLACYESAKTGKVVTVG